jgi:hypothetical protein
MFTLPYLYNLISNTCYDELLVFEWHQVIYPPLSQLGIFTIVLNHLNFVYNCQIKYILCVCFWWLSIKLTGCTFPSAQYQLYKKLSLDTNGANACISFCLKQLSPHLYNWNLNQVKISTLILQTILY